MQFSQLNLTVDGQAVVYNPYDRGTNGAFVFRRAGTTLQAPRLIIETQVDDNASDKYAIRDSIPRMSAPVEGVSSPTLLGTDMVKTELRFLATTNESARINAIDTHIAELQELREVFEKREKMYS